MENDCYLTIIVKKEHFKLQSIKNLLLPEFFNGMPIKSVVNKINE